HGLFGKVGSEENTGKVGSEHSGFLRISTAGGELALSLRPIAVVDVTIGLAALCVKSFGERCDAQQQMCPGSGGYARRFGPVMTMNMFKMNVVHAAGRLVLAPASPG